MNTMLRAEPIVRTAYDFLDRLLPQAGVRDLTEGIYNGDLATPYEVAQERQLNFLLDEISCREGFRLLDIGCGTGTLLEQAEKRGAKATGITVSPRQAKRCRQAGLDVHLVSYRDVGAQWTRQFDGIVANGSAEHFVQPQDALAGKSRDIYREMFAICHHLLDPAGPGRFATTIIHFRGKAISPQLFLRHPFRSQWGTQAFHVAMLHHTLGGYYPVEGQLAECAQCYFSLVSEVDGTDDYRLTSEEWLRRTWRALRSPVSWVKLAPFLLTQPHQGFLLLLLALTESWQWQFRGEEVSPTKLLCQTWQRVDLRTRRFY
jgi:cyclopropane fatty-acyl-phospholipid synthase-like methyltransferase